MYFHLFKRKHTLHRLPQSVRSHNSNCNNNIIIINILECKSPRMKMVGTHSETNDKKKNTRQNSNETKSIQLNWWCSQQSGGGYDCSSGGTKSKIVKCLFSDLSVSLRWLSAAVCCCFFFCVVSTSSLIGMKNQHANRFGVDPEPNFQTCERDQTTRTTETHWLLVSCKWLFLYSIV